MSKSTFLLYQIASIWILIFYSAEATYTEESKLSYLPVAPGNRPKCAGDSDTFCTKTDYYPTDIIESLMKHYSFDFKSLLQDESNESAPNTSSTKSNGQVYVPTLLPNVSHRQPPSEGQNWWTRYAAIGDRRRQKVSSSFRVARQVPNEESLCPTTSSFITPKLAVNTKGNWVYVVNLEQGESTTQLVRTERCATSQCSGLCTIPAGFTSSCSQQFVQKRLVALNGDGESLYTDTFWFPHCCVCQIRATV